MRRVGATDDARVNPMSPDPIPLVYYIPPPSLYRSHGEDHEIRHSQSTAKQNSARTARDILSGEPSINSPPPPGNRAPLHGGSRLVTRSARGSEPSSRTHPSVRCSPPQPTSPAPVFKPQPVTGELPCAGFRPSTHLGPDIYATPTRVPPTNRGRALVALHSERA